MQLEWNMQRGKTLVRIEAQNTWQRDSFQYLGSIFSMDGEINEEVERRIRMGWLKWIYAYEVVWEWCIVTRLKGKFYRITIKLAYDV